MPYIHIPSRIQNDLLCLFHAHNITNIAQYHSYNSFSVISITTRPNSLINYTFFASTYIEMVYDVFWQDS